MNTNKILSGLACVLVAGFAGSAAIAMDGNALRAHREQDAQKQERRQERQQDARNESRYANNPAPPRQGPPPRQAPPSQEPPRQAPPRQGPPRQGPPGDVSSPGGRGNSNFGGRGSGGHNGSNRNVGTPPVHYSPPAHVNQPGYKPRPGYSHQPGYSNRPGYSHRPGYVRPPRYVSSLPYGYHSHYWNGSPYYYHTGLWYRPYGSTYMVVSAPYGLFVNTLPYYSSFWYGSTRYYVSDGAYYTYEPVRRGYVVAPSPYGDDQAGEGGSVDDELYVYPAQGQSEQQQADDRYECHRWAVDQTQYDPVESSYDAGLRADYTRAITACLTGRGYTVR